MKHKAVCLVACGIGCLMPRFVGAQFNVLGGTHGRTNAAITQGVTIGNITATPAGQAFQVRGDLLGAGFNTGEVFKTDAPNANSTYWRMFRGGIQYGLLYNLTGSNDFNAQVLPIAGNLWLRNSLSNGLRLNAGTLTTTIGTYSPTISNFVGIGPGAGIIGTQGAWARLHLDDGGGVITSAYRPWMKNGIYMSGNSDMMYVGQLFRAGADESDAVIAWGDNAAAPAGPDHLRFLFMGSGLEGQEVTRITGNGEFGVGNFDLAGVQPTEKLDVLTGRLRLRALPSSVPANTMTKVLVVDDTPSPSGERGVIKWRDISTIGGADCDWQVTNVEHVVTAFDGMLVGGAPCQPDNGSGVGIGLFTPKAKLDVWYTGASNHGLTGTLATHSAYRNTLGGTGVLGSAITLAGTQFATGLFVGVHGQSGNAEESYGVYGDGSITANSPLTANEVVGVVGSARGNNKATTAIGVKGRATGGITNTYAIWSEGAQFSTTAGTWTTSDAQLKQNVEPQQGALGIIRELRPSTYTFRTEEFQFLQLDQGLQHGLIAQEVEAVLPELVRPVLRPADVDSTGNVLTPSMELKAVNYEMLIPIMISAIKEQDEQITALREALASCCSATDAGRALPQTNKDLISAGDDLFGSDKLLIQPNPFNERTTVYYTVDRRGRTQLLANSSDGRDLRVLQEASMEAGSYQFEWDTASLAPGMYYVTLLLDGQPVVKKAVKVDR